MMKLKDPAGIYHSIKFARGRISMDIWFYSTTEQTDEISQIVAYLLL